MELLEAASARPEPPPCCSAGRRNGHSSQCARCAAWSAWGCSLGCVGLQPGVRMAAAWCAWGCCLDTRGSGFYYMGFQCAAPPAAAARPACCK